MFSVEVQPFRTHGVQKSEGALEYQARFPPTVEIWWSWEILSFPRAIGGIVLVRDEGELPEKSSAIRAKDGKVDIWGRPRVDELTHCRKLVVGRFAVRGRELSTVFAVVHENSLDCPLVEYQDFGIECGIN